MSLKLIKLGLLVMHLLLFLVSCGGILVHGHRPPCADLCSHVCGLERSELRGEKGRVTQQGGGVSTETSGGTNLKQRPIFYTSALYML